MNIQYNIISFEPSTGSLLVHYYSDEVPDGLTYNIDIPIENGVFIGQDKIDELIMVMAPVGQLERIAALKAAEVPPALAAFVMEPPITPTVDVTQPVIIGVDAPPSV